MNYPLYSYNSLMVPLDIGTWQCELVLSREYDELVRQRQWSRRDRLRSGSDHRSNRTHRRSCATSWSAFDRDDDDEADERRQREDDRRTFDLYFRPKYDFRQLLASDINAITSFLRDHVNVAHWDLPTDNAGIERALKQAVADGRLVPVVNRNWRSFPMTFRPAPAPLRWPPSVNSSPVVQVVPYGGGLSAAVSTAPFLAGAEAVSGSSGVHGGGFDWPGIATAVAGAALGSDDGSDNTDDDGGGDTSTPLGDAQPFRLGDDTASVDAEQHAASFKLSPAEQDDCLGQWERDESDCYLFGKMMGGSRGVEMCLTQARNNYNLCMGHTQRL